MDAEDTLQWSPTSNRAFPHSDPSFIGSPERTGGEELAMLPEEEEPYETIPPDEWVFGLPQPTDWTGNFQHATVTRDVPGMHVSCTYRFMCLHRNSPLPIVDSVRKRGLGKVGHLPLIERGGRGRPRLSDHTLGDYLARTSNNTEQPLENRIGPTHPAKNIYTLGGGEWIVYDYVREPRCRNCNKPMSALNGRNCRQLDNFRFRACCYPAPKFYNLKPTALVEVAVVRTLVYDLETTPDDDGVHELYLGVLQLPDELAQQLGSEFATIKTADEFFQYVDAALDLYSKMFDEQVCLQLVSFNGSRYDDLFLTTAWRRYIARKFGDAELRGISYSERNASMNFNTYVAGNVEIKWTDLARFVPPTSLRKLAKSFNLTEEKGSLPFEALNDYVQRGPGSVVRDDDGFLSLEVYYHGDADARRESFEYYQQCVPVESRTPSRDIPIFCEEYCKQDVRVTKAAYDVLSRLYATYLAEEASKGHEDGVRVNFNPMCLHSLSTMAGRIMMASAYGSESWGWDSRTREERLGLWVLKAPVDECYDYVRQSIVGGWVKGYFQGLLVDSSTCPPGLLDIISNLHTDRGVPVADHAHDMTDIASMYPVAVTYPMPVGAGYFVHDPEERVRLINEVINEPDPIKIHKFFLRAQWKAPENPMFFESTLPQRKEKTNALRWTYWDDNTGTRVVTSLDLWIACRDHTNSGPDACWKVHDCVDLLMFDQSAQIYRPFMEACARLKMDGSREGNEEKRTIGKIAMNSAIGKLGQGIETQQNIIGDNEAREFATANCERARLVGTTPLALGGGEETEYIFGLKDTSKNRWPIHHAAFMYAATRLIRLNWSLLTRPPELAHVPIYDLPFPDTIYGDTDSKVLLTQRSSLMPAEFIGNEVGMFLPELDNGLDTRPFFQVEPEAVCGGKFKACISGFNTSKKYFVAGYDGRDGWKLKFKCNGVPRFSADKHPCNLHSAHRCPTCVCRHKTYNFECVPCSLSLLHNETYIMTPTDVIAQNSTDGYKYSLRELHSLSFLDFLRTLVTGHPCRIVNTTFVRTLSLPTSKLPPFTVQTKSTSRTLSRPLVLSSVVEIATDRPRVGLAPYISGCGHISGGVLFPSGSYLVGRVPQRQHAEEVVDDDDDDDRELPRKRARRV